MQKEDAQATVETNGDRTGDASSRRRSTAESDLVTSVDPYGWRMAEHEVTKTEKKQLKIEDKKVMERTEKWDHMFQDIEKFRKKHRKTWEGRILKGIPDSWRGRAWIYILSDGGIEKSAGVDHYANLGIPKGEPTITVDVPRTMQDHILFGNQDMQDRLHKCLRAFANRYPEIGYVQGMAFPAAMLFAYGTNDDEIFDAYCNMMVGKVIGLGKLYANDWEGFKRMNAVWKVIFEDRYPKVAAHVREQQIADIMYTPSRFLCAFMNITMPSVLRLKIFDRFVAFGLRALLSLSLVFISLTKRELIVADQVGCLKILQNPDATDWPRVMKKWEKLWIGKTDYKKFQEKAGVSLVFD